MAIINFAHYVFCSSCGRSWGSLSTWDRGFNEVIREAYAKGWVTCCKSRYDGGDGEHRAYCPSCAPQHKENRFAYCDVPESYFNQ